MTTLVFCLIFLNTLYIVIATLVIVLPLGVGAAIYLTEYATNKKIVGMIEYAAETLSGIPSIIYGLVGMLFFCQFFKLADISFSRCAYSCDHESSNYHAYHTGELKDSSAKLP